MITWREVAAGEDGLRLYRVDAEAEAFAGALWTGRSALHDRTSATLTQARERYGQLEFRSRGLA